MDVDVCARGCACLCVRIVIVCPGVVVTACRLLVIADRVVFDWLGCSRRRVVPCVLRERSAFLGLSGLQWVRRHADRRGVSLDRIVVKLRRCVQRMMFQLPIEPQVILGVFVVRIVGLSVFFER